MSSNRSLVAAPVLALLLTVSWRLRAAGEAGACPIRDRQALRLVDVFDGPPEEMATLVPDQAGERIGYWQLGYLYDAGRFVVIRCKYADHKTVDVKLAHRVNRCDYTIDGRKTLKVVCK